MDGLMVSLRVLHVVFGTFWAGTTFFSTLILEPRLRRLGPGIRDPVMGALMPVITPAMMLSSVVVLGTGVALTLIMRWATLSDFLATRWGWAVLVGLLATVAAMVVGFGLLAPTGLKIEKLSKGIVGRAPNPDETLQLQSLAARIETLSRVNFVSILIAVGAMAAARYL
ncbi:MAG: hypothetical protein HYX89_07945 [Chloroflexi bacterium]|nr:hypothetical protein [Chloroflexota bacterium]